jgi:hypothetical protein
VEIKVEAEEPSCGLVPGRISTYRNSVQKRWSIMHSLGSIFGAIRRPVE